MQEEKLRKGPWLKEEDEKLAAAVAVLGESRWDSLAKASGLRRSGKSCRLRWMNYLRPDLKHGHLTVEEQHVLNELHEKWGNKWSRIAQRLPGRTDNEIKNYWKSYVRKKARTLEKGTESLSSAIDSSGNTSLRSECETASPCSINDESLMLKDDTLEFMTADSCEAVELSNLTCSPYETRLTEWISSVLPLPSDSCKTEFEDEYWNFNIYRPEWISDDYRAGAWDLSLWDGA